MEEAQRIEKIESKSIENFVMELEIKAIMMLDVLIVIFYMIMKEV